MDWFNLQALPDLIQYWIKQPEFENIAAIVGGTFTILTGTIGFIIRKRKRNKAISTLQILNTSPKEKEAQTSETLIKQAQQAEKNQSYQEAIERWKQVKKQQPDHETASKEIKRLQQQLKHKDQIKLVINQLYEHLQEIAPVFAHVAMVLQNIEEHPKADFILDKTQQFLQKKLTAEQYIKHCHSELSKQQTTDQSLDYTALAKRISSGNTALFLGSEIPHEYGENCKDEQALAKALAENTNYTDFNGSFSSIAEYYQLRPEYGRSSLQENLKEHLFDKPAAIRLYKQLAHTDESLVIIAAHYDDMLEKTFQHYNKPHAVLSSILNQGSGYDIGKLLLKYSDKPEEEQIILADDCSKLNLLEQGYTLIYKLKGTCNDTDCKKQSDSLLVSESNYFTFARHTDKIIPSYLVTLLIERSLMFIGFNPKSWEDRLLVTALLEKRSNSSELCYSTNISQDPLQSAYWDKQKVQQYDINIQRLDKELEGLVA